MEFVTIPIMQPLFSTEYSVTGFHKKNHIKMTQNERFSNSWNFCRRIVNQKKNIVIMEGMFSWSFHMHFSSEIELRRFFFFVFVWKGICYLILFFVEFKLYGFNCGILLLIVDCNIFLITFWWFTACIIIFIVFLCFLLL